MALVSTHFARLDPTTGSISGVVESFRRPNLFVPLLGLGLSLVPFFFSIFHMQSQTVLLRRRAQASEIRALEARLLRFDAKLDAGKVLSEEEMQEGKRMKRVIDRWLRSLEDSAATSNEKSSWW